MTVSMNAFNQLPIRLGKRFPIVAARTITVFMLILLVWALGRIAWIWVDAEPNITFSNSSSVAPTQQRTESYQISQLVEQNIFGAYLEPASAPQPVVTNAPETKLNVTLVGVVASTDPKYALAVISGGNAQQVYGIGETIRNSRAVVRQVLSDRVIITNNRRDEVLMLDGLKFEPNAAPTPVPVTPAPSQAAETPAANADELAEIRAEILSNPQSLLRYITLSQQRGDDGVIGYRIGPGSDSRLFNSAGLITGDVVVNINGSDLRNPAEMAGIWQKLSDASEINLTVLRNGQEHNVLIGL